MHQPNDGKTGQEGILNFRKPNFSSPFSIFLHDSPFSRKSRACEKEETGPEKEVAVHLGKTSKIVYN